MGQFDKGQFDNAGRIPRRAFLVTTIPAILVRSRIDSLFKVSTLTLLIIVLVSATARFYVRIRIQKQVSIDDAFLLFGICCLISALGIIYTISNEMYLVESLLFSVPNLQLPPDWMQQSFDYQKFVTVSLILTWFSIISVKFSFLFLFRKLIDRVRYMVIYWWVVVIFNLAIAGYGASVYILGCPWFYSIKACEFCLERASSH
jgi:hypothetical protein